MAGRPTWTGAIEFAGFSIHVRAHSMVKSRGAQSFKTLAPNGLPIHQQLVDSDGEVVERDDCSKGVEVSAGTFAALPDEAVEMIAAAERSASLEIRQFAPKSTVPLHLATGHYRLVPDEKVAGSEQPVSILWNGLLATERALLTQWVPRSGSRDALVAVHAGAEGLTLNTLPYKVELQDLPAWTPTEDEKAADVFARFIEAQEYDLADFEWDQFESDYEQRRDEAIAKALAGETITVPQAPAPTKVVPDLMAAMSAAMDGNTNGKKKAPAKKAAKTKAAA